MLSGASKVVIAVSTVFPGLAFFAVALRIYARRLKTQVFAADDFLIVLALVGDLLVFPTARSTSLTSVDCHLGKLRSVHHRFVLPPTERLEKSVNN